MTESISKIRRLPKTEDTQHWLLASAHTRPPCTHPAPPYKEHRLWISHWGSIPVLLTTHYMTLNKLFDLHASFFFQTTVRKLHLLEIKLWSFLNNCLIPSKHPLMNSCYCFIIVWYGQWIYGLDFTVTLLWPSVCIISKKGWRGSEGIVCKRERWWVLKPFLGDWCLCCSYGSLGNKITSGFQWPNSMSDNFSRSGSYSFRVA